MARFIPMTQSDLVSLYHLAAPIWRECYAQILPQEQIELLLRKYFMPSALMRSRDEGMRYEIILDKWQYAGFIAYRQMEEYLYLDKLYLKRECRGRHITAKTLRYLDRFELPIRLNVNEKNTPAQRAYLANGFQTLCRQTILLPGGYTNNDFVMQRPYPIRAAIPQDIQKISAAWRGDCADFAASDYWEDRYPPAKKSGDKPEILVYDDGKPRGFIALDNDRILALHVPSEYRRTGVASALLRAVEQRAKKPLAVCVYLKNKCAVCFYQAQQFTVAKNENGLLTMTKE